MEFATLAALHHTDVLYTKHIFKSHFTIVTQLLKPTNALTEYWSVQDSNFEMRQNKVFPIGRQETKKQYWLFVWL